MLSPDRALYKYSLRRKAVVTTSFQSNLEPSIRRDDRTDFCLFGFGFLSAFIHRRNVAGETMLTSCRRVSLEIPRAALTSSRRSSGVVQIVLGSRYRSLWFSVFR